MWITLSSALQFFGGTAAMSGDEAACQQGLYVAVVEVPEDLGKFLSVPNTVEELLDDGGDVTSSCRVPMAADTKIFKAVHRLDPSSVKEGLNFQCEFNHWLCFVLC